MTPDERRAEIEAVAAAIDASRPRTMAWRAWTLHLAEEAIAALDRVRDARDDDEAAPKDRRLRRWWCSTCGTLTNHETAEHVAQSPQGEDHDDKGRRRYPTILQGEAATAARRAEHSTSREGTVAVENVVAWLRSVDGGLQHGWAKKAADAIEREFSPASTGNRRRDG